VIVTRQSSAMSQVCPNARLRGAAE
jgi:hypothetical protein